MKCTRLRGRGPPRQQSRSNAWIGRNTSAILWWGQVKNVGSLQGQYELFTPCFFRCYSQSSGSYPIDGAYSTVRQLIFDNLTKLGRLPFQDRSGFRNPYLTLVGTTTRLPPDDFKNVDEHFCYFYQTIGKGKFSVSVICGRGREWGVLRINEG